MALVAKLMMGGTAIAIAGVLGYTLVIEPRAQKRAAAKQVAAWGDSWTEERACLLREPLSADPVESLALYEVTDAVGRLRLERCRKLVKELTRPEGDSSDVDDIEDGWSRLREAVEKMSLALSDYTADQPSKPMPEVRAELVRTIAGVDAASAELRAACDLPKLTWPSGGPAPVAAAPLGTVLQVGGNQDVAPESALAAGSVLVVTGHSGGGPELLVIRGPDAIDTVHLAGEGVTRAIATQEPWGTRLAERGEQTELEAVALDSAGEADPAQPAAVVARAPAGSLAPMIAIGDGAVRVVVWAQDKPNQDEDSAVELWLARSRDHGKSFAERRRLATLAGDDDDSEAAASWALARTDLTWRGPEGQLMWLPLAADTLGGALAPTQLTDGSEEFVYRRSCFGARMVWWITSSGVTRRPQAGGDTSPTVARPPASDLLSCDDDMLVAPAFGLSDLAVERCTKDRCATEGRLPYTRETSFAAAIGPVHGVTVATLQDGYLVRWRFGENGVLTPRPIYRVAGDGVRLAALAEWNGVIYALLFEPARARLVPLPE